MAQTGYTPILIYSSSTASNAPAVGNLTNSTLGSELAINITDGKLFYKDNANAIQVIGWKVRPATAGGTGLTSFAVGDLLYADTTTTLAKLADVATGNALISGGVGVAPSWGKIGLTTHVSGVLPTANGGTNLSSFTANGVMYASSVSALATGSNLLFDGTTLNVGLSEFVGRLAATSGYAKTDTSERRTLSIRSTEALASNPLELYFALRGNATASAQMGVIQAGHYGADFNATLALNPNASTGSILFGTYTIPSSWGISVGVVGTVGQVLGGMQNTNWRIREKSAVDWCAWTTNQNDAGGQDDAGKSSWMTQQGYGGGNDAWRVARAPAGSSSFAELVRIDNAGNFIVGNTTSNFAASNAIMQGASFEIKSNSSANVANNGTMALYPGANRFVGFLTVACVNSASANVRTTTTYSVFILDGDNTSIQQISTATGSGGGSTFTVGYTNGTGFVITNTAGAARSLYAWCSGQWIG
jgi:hypothetical protein